jgi:AraC-like DNA-binding protein
MMLRSHMVPIFVRRAHRLGVRVEDLIERHRIVLEDDNARIACSTFRTFTDALAERGGDARFGFHAALDMPRGAYGLVEYVARNTPTVRALIHQLVRFSRLINDRLVARFDSETGRLDQRIEGEPTAMGKQGNEFSLAHQLKVVRDSCGVRIAPDRVFFAHAAPSVPDDEVAHFFGAREVLYSSGFNGVDVSSSALDTPLASADPSLFRVLEARATELAHGLGAGETGDVQRVIQSELEIGEPTAKRVAQVLALSERTLHRRLAAEGSSFGTLVDRLREKLALVYLEDSARSVTDVALLLGYSDGRAFARAFRRWTKTTPLGWRASRQGLS